MEVILNLRIKSTSATSDKTRRTRYSENLLEKQHGYLKAEGAMGIFKITSNGRDMDTWE